jgi:hypothetical protein
MAEYLSSINSALSQLFAPDLYTQWNRTAVLLGALSARGDVGDGQGKNVAFDVEFTGNQALTVAEGSDVASTEYASDVNVAAILPWAHYRTAFQISETEYNAAMSSGGTPAALRQLFGHRVMAGGNQLMRKIEQDLMTGTGVDASGNPTIVGLYGGGLVTSGDYAGINIAAYPEWASNIVANGGVPRSLTPDLLALGDAEVFIGSSEPWNMVMTSAGVTRKYESLFTTGTYPLIRMNDGAGSPQYGAGVSLDGQAQPTGLFYKGQAVIRNAVNPVGKLALINTNKIAIKYLPHVQPANEGGWSQVVEGVGSNGGGNIQATKIPIRIAMLAKTGESYKVMMTVTIQAAFTRPNAFAIVQDISEV